MQILTSNMIGKICNENKIQLAKTEKDKEAKREELTCIEYGDKGSTEEGDETELRVWAGDRESTFTSPSGNTRTKTQKCVTLYILLYYQQMDLICSLLGSVVLLRPMVL